MAHEHDETLGAPLASAPNDTPPPGDVLAGRYRILGMLGVGGMGAVYRVRDLELDEVVALKTLKRGFLDTAGALERFRREVKLARKVTHPNVARTFDIGEHRGERGESEKFLTMEYVDGVSLGRRLEEGGALGVAEAARIAIAISNALDAAHGASVVHRDLKPDNVLLERGSGRVVVTDFGIARSHVEDASSTAAGAVVGTPAYMAPEQVEGAAIDGRADLYALGLVLYEMLVGAPAFTGATPFALAAARLVAPAPDPLRACPTLPAPLASLVSRLLARRPADRPASAADVRTSLEPLAKESIAPPPTLARPIVPEVARSIVVLPLSMDGPPEDAWLGEGATADLIDALSMVRGLRVRARAAPDAGEDARSFGRRMGVELVASGSLRRVGDTIRLTTRLLGVVDGFQIWAGRSEGSLGELLVMTDRAARELSAAAAGAEPGRPQPSAESPEVIALHLRARKLTTQILADEKLVAQLPELHREARDHPRVLSSVAAVLARASGVGPPERIREARQAAERAIELSPELGEPWVALAHVRLNEGDTPGAMRALRRALRNAPSLAEAHDLAGRILQEANQHEDALRFLERALWLDPELWFARVDVVRIHALAGDWDRAERELAVLERSSGVHYVASSTRLSLWTERPLAASFDFSRAGLLRDTFEALAAIASTRRIADAQREALAGMLGKARAGTRLARLYRQLSTEAHAYAGEREAALHHLEDAVANGLEDLAWVLRCPVLAPLRDSERYERARDTVAARARAILAAWREG